MVRLFPHRPMGNFRARRDLHSRSGLNDPSKPSATIATTQSRHTSSEIQHLLCFIRETPSPRCGGLTLRTERSTTTAPCAREQHLGVTLSSQARRSLRCRCAGVDFPTPISTPLTTFGIEAFCAVLFKRRCFVKLFAFTTFQPFVTM